MPIISKTAGDTDLVTLEHLGCIGDVLWQVEWSGACWRRVCLSSYAELLVCYILTRHFRKR